MRATTSLLPSGFEEEGVTFCSGRRPESVVGQKRKCPGLRGMSASPSILLQKSKVASVRIFGETLKREAVDDSDDLSRAPEFAYEFSVRGRGPSNFYTKNVPVRPSEFLTPSAKRLLHTICQTRT